MTWPRFAHSWLALTVTVAGCLVGSPRAASAQLTVYDPAVTTRNTVTAIVKESLRRTQQEQHSQLRRMAQRLSMFTNLASSIRMRLDGGSTTRESRPSGRHPGAACGTQLRRRGWRRLSGGESSGQTAAPLVAARAGHGGWRSRAWRR